MDRVGVIGAGTMGHGIAQVAATAGCTVVMSDVSLAAAQSGLERIHANLAGAVQRGKMTALDAGEVVSRIAVVVGVEAAAESADLVIEAVPEDADLKKQTLRSVEHVAPQHAILASNTSSLSVTDLQSATDRPGQVIGMHFFNPVHIMRLVEIVRGQHTLEATVESCRRFVVRIGKEAIVVKDSPGFATSRLGIALGNEAMRMLEQGVASAADIDKAMELGYRHPMGPLRLSDLVGLDVRLAITTHLYRDLASEVFSPPEILRRLVEQGKLGKKSGAGFYDYGE